MRKMLIGIAAMLLLSLGGYVGIANAHSFRTGDNVVVEQGQTINDTLFISGRTVDVASEVFGDVICAGQNISVSGTIHGDVICAGQTVNISGTVDGDVRAAGQTVNLNGAVSGNASIASQTFNLGSSAQVSQDVSLLTGDGNFNGSVGRDVASGGGTVILANQVGRNVKGNIEHLKLTSTAKVQGNIDNTSKNDIDRASGAIVGGKITRTEPKNQGEPKRGAVFGFGVFWFIYWFLAMLLTALALVLLIPALINRASDRALAKPWKAPLIGFLASIGVPVLLIVLAITVIGLPLALLLALLWFVILVLSGPFFGYFIGRLLLRDSRQPIIIMLLGGSLLLVLYFIPIFGVIALFAAMWFGSGMILMELADRTPRPVYSLAANNEDRANAKRRSAKK